MHPVTCRESVSIVTLKWTLSATCDRVHIGKSVNHNDLLNFSQRHSISRRGK